MLLACHGYAFGGKGGGGVTDLVTFFLGGPMERFVSA